MANFELENEDRFEWQTPVREALLELDPERLEQKVANAEAAIFERLQVLSGDNGTAEERQALQDATNSLRVVKREVLKFPDWQVD
jgi:hypothetical protein